MSDIIKAYAIKNLCYKSAQKMVPKGIVVHSTGVNNPNLKRYVDAPNEVGINPYGNHWNNPKPDGRKVCVHAFIGYALNGEIRVAEILPLNICCWGVGQGKKGSYNYDPSYIQFEICEDGLSDSEYYRNAFDKAIKYCAKLCKDYGISVENIVGHCEAYKQGYGSNNSDPEHWMKRHGESMNEFRNAVSNLLDKSNTIKETIKVSPSPSAFHKGDLVSISDSATYYNGDNIPTWVKAQNWYIKEESTGDRAVIDQNENGTNSICSPINTRFLRLVNSSNAVTSSFSPYQIKVTTDSLNIRRGAGTNYPIVGAITDAGVYTIVEECIGKGANLWGRLKSGVGWISLDFTRKI